MAPKFGTSGLRGLVVELTTDVVKAHVHAFIGACPTGTGLFIGHDLRTSSPMLADTIAQAAHSAGLAVTNCGPVPTPALALAAMDAGAAAIMVTGSHIPADRNGLKFYTPDGEITKPQEQAILALRDADELVGLASDPVERRDISDIYSARYRGAFAGILTDKRIGLYAHSAVGRDALHDLLVDLGAEVITLGRSDVFVPVDTEAVSVALRGQLRDWAATHKLDAIVSTDADGDRPLLTDEAGQVVTGDVLGQIAARGLGAAHVVTPISSNSGVAYGGHFDTVARTKIGSPYVIAGMAETSGKTVGYEANGGFLLGFEATGPTGPLPALLTRDALLPVLMVLAMAGDGSVADLVAQEPECFTASDRLQEVNIDRANTLLASLSTSLSHRQAFLVAFGAGEAVVDETDGLRLTMPDGRVVHLRMSGNAPEMRVYAETHTAAAAQELLQIGMLETERLLKNA